MKPVILKHVIEVLTDAALIALAGDLLYLYFEGCWYELNPIILWSELIVLPCIILLGIFRVCRYCKTKGG